MKNPSITGKQTLMNDVMKEKETKNSKINKNVRH